MFYYVFETTRKYHKNIHFYIYILSCIFQIFYSKTKLVQDEFITSEMHNHIIHLNTTSTTSHEAKQGFFLPPTICLLVSFQLVLILNTETEQKKSLVKAYLEHFIINVCFKIRLTIFFSNNIYHLRNYLGRPFLRDTNYP